MIYYLIRCCVNSLSQQCVYFSIPETIRRMVVDHAGGLHVGVYDGGADEVEAAAFEVPGDFI